MAIPNIAKLLVERERRDLLQFTNARAMHGISTFNNLALLPNNIMTGKEVDGFIFGKDIWGVGQFSAETSPLGEKYGLS